MSEGSQREPNLPLVKKFIDINAELIGIVSGGKFLRMKAVGSVCGEEPIPASRFVEVSK